MQKKYSNIITDFLSTHPAISMNRVEEDLGVPQSTLFKAKGDRLIPTKHIYPLLCYLAGYGLKIDGYDLSYDPADDTLTGRRWVDNVDTIEEDGGFVYVVKEYRLLAAGYFDLL